MGDENSPLIPHLSSLIPRINKRPIALIPGRVDLAGFDGGEDGAARLVQVVAVGIVALIQVWAEFGVEAVEVVGVDAPEAQGADAGGICHPGIGRDAEEGRPGGCVAALAGCLADLT